MELLVLTLAFGAGLLSRHVGYPPLLGYLLAGFIAHAAGWSSSEALAPFAEAGIILLLFCIGLKLNPASLAPRYVWGSAILHMLIAIPLTAAVIYLVGGLYQPLNFDNDIEPWTLAFALSFSSTVLAVKLFEERGESKSLYATIAIGILVVQDIFAVGYLVVSSGYLPSPWALALLALPLTIPLFRKLLPVLGHGEIQLLAAVLLALGAAAVFELVSLKGGLGALAVGMLIGRADRERARELHIRLDGIKNLLLIGFFVQIGYYGIPQLELLAVAIVLGVLITLRPLIYFSLLTAFKLRVRTAWLTGLALFNYSEFGLIVAAIAAENNMLGPEWITTLALAMALSFFLATPINKQAHELFRRYESSLKKHERPERLPEEITESLHDTDIALLGMGRVGRGAYEYLAEQGMKGVTGVDENFANTNRLKSQGWNCIHADASDRDFWATNDLAHCKLILISLTNLRENKRVAKLAREFGYTGKIAVAIRFPDEAAQFEGLNVNCYYLYKDVGRDFAEHMAQYSE